MASDPAPTGSIEATSTTHLSSTTTSSSSTTTSSTTTSSTTSTSTTTPPTSTTTTIPGPLTATPSPAEQPVVEQFVVRAATLMGGKVRAIGVAIARDQSVIASFSLGNDAAGRPLTDTAGFRLASISKLLTATVVMQFVEEGKINLDDSLGSLWGDPVGSADPRVADITVRQLLGHTSGFGPLRATFFGNGADNWHTAAAIALGSVLDHAPGTFYRYSNANYVVLGALVERLTGSTLQDEVTRRVLTPLGVTTGVMGTSTAVTDLNGPAYLVDGNRRYIEALGPAGAWIMSPADIARVLAALQPGGSRPLLSDASLTAMRTANTLPDDEPNWSYGLGLMVFPTWVGHTGTIEDVKTFVLALPNGYTVSVLTATGKVGSGEDLLAEFLPELVTLAALPPATSGP